MNLFCLPGEIHGTLHRKVLEDYQTDLAPGAGLILKHVSIIKLTTKTNYKFRTDMFIYLQCSMIIKREDKLTFRTFLKQLMVFV